MTNSDKILRIIGEFGKYQRRLLVIIFVFSVISSWGILPVIFNHYVPRHHCFVSTGQNASDKTSADKLVDEEWLNKTTPWIFDDDGIPVRSSCEMYSSVATENRTLNHTSNDTMKCTKFYFYTDKDGGETVASEMKLVCNNAWIIPSILSAMMLARAVGCVVAGGLADKYGVRPVFLVASVSTVLIFLGMILSPNIYVYACFLVLQGVCSSILYSKLFVIATETVIPKYRNRMAMAVNFGYCVGYAILPMLAYFSHGWRWLLGFISIANIILLLGYWFVQEPLRRLISNGKMGKAKKLIGIIAKYNGIHLEEREIVRMIEDDSDDTVEKDKNKGSSQWLDFLKNAVMRRRLFTVAFSWMAVSLIYYAIALNSSSLHGDKYINCFVSAILEIPSILLACFSLERIGRVKTNLLLAFFGSIACIAVPFMRSLSPWTISVLAISGKTAMTGLFYVVYVQSVELSPTPLRNVFMSVCIASANLGNLLSPFVMYLEKVAHDNAIPYIVMGCLGLLSFSASIFLPETKELVLPDTVEEALQQKSFLWTACRRRNADIPKKTKDIVDPNMEKLATM